MWPQHNSGFRKARAEPRHRLTWGNLCSPLNLFDLRTLLLFQGLLARWQCEDRINAMVQEQEVNPLLLRHSDSLLMPPTSSSLRCAQRGRSTMAQLRTGFPHVTELLEILAVHTHHSFLSTRENF